MSFNQAAFMAANFEPRTKDIPLPDLQSFFEKEAVWTVRSMTAVEMHKANTAETRNSQVMALAEALVADGKTRKDRIADIRAAVGLSDDVPGEIAKRIESLVMASVCPQVDTATVVRLAENFPTEFYQLTNTIFELTAQGACTPGESKPSGTTSE